MSVPDGWLALTALSDTIPPFSGGVMSETRTHLSQVDLATDPLAARYAKDETVTVQFALEDGALMSLEGANAYRCGDALVSAQTGEQWVVSRDRFEPKYRPASGQSMGQDGAYRNVPTLVWGRCMAWPFSIARSSGGDVLTGEAGDWLLQYAPGDYGVVQQLRFARVYRRSI